MFLIQVHIKPKDNLPSDTRKSESEMHLCGDVVELDARSSESRSVEDSALSRALKRKFTELEEITQRLRARLFDVTGNMSIDPDDEFENDLNTIPDEDNDDFEESNISNEMSLDWIEYCQNQANANESNYKLNSCPSSIADQMHDFLELFSPNSAQSNQTQNEHFNAILNDDMFQSDSIDRSESSVHNIAESLQKSFIND